MTLGGVATAVPAGALWLFPAFTPIDVAAPAVTVTLACSVIATELIVADTTFVPATVELNVPVVTPLAFVGGGWVRVFPVPVADSVTDAPLTGLPFASFAVTVMVLALVPELAVIVV